MKSGSASFDCSGWLRLALTASGWLWLALASSDWVWLAGWLPPSHGHQTLRPCMFGVRRCQSLTFTDVCCKCLKLEAKRHRNDFTAHTKRLVIRQCSPRMVRIYNRTAVATKKRFECTHVVFGDSALCSSVIGKSWETISLHTQSVWCNVFKGAEEGPKRNVDISLVLEDFVPKC